MFGEVPGYLGSLVLGRPCDTPHPVEGELCLLEAMEGARSKGLEFSTCGGILSLLEGKSDEGILQSMLLCCVYTIISSGLHTNHISTSYGIAGVGMCRPGVFEISIVV